MRIDLQSDADDSASHILREMWTFFLGCVFLIAGLAHSVIPWMLDHVVQLGHGFDAIEILRSWTSRADLNVSIVGVSALFTVLHLARNLVQLVHKFTRRRPW